MEDKISVKGVWWSPDDHDSKINGHLTIEPNSNAKLEIEGSFGDMDSELENQPIILGIGNGKKYTLVNCLQLGWHFCFEDVVYNTQIYDIQTILEGIHTDVRQEFTIKELNVHYKNLETWMKARNIRREYENDRNIIIYERPEDIKIKFNNSSFLTISPSVSINTHRNSVNISDDYHIRFKFENGKDLDEIFNTLSIFQNFLSFSMMNKTYITKLKGSVDDEKQKEFQIYLFNNLLTDSTDVKDLQFNNLLFLYPDIKNIFETTISNWYDIQNKFHSVINLYFTTIYNPKLYIENIFLNRTQALEVYHRISDNYYEYIKEPSEHEKIINQMKEILNSSEKSNKREIKKYIGYLKTQKNKPYLAFRIKQLLNSYPDIFSIIIDDFNQFTDNVVKTRNDLTHSKNKSVEPRYPEIYNLSVKIEGMIYAIIMIEIGFKKKEIQKFLNKFKEKNHYEYIKWL